MINPPVSNTRRIPRVSTQRSLTWNASGHFPPLDGLRGIAILLVMIVHFAEHSVSMDESYRTYRSILGTGWVGVDLFFVLSGFLITGILIETRNDTHYYRNFYARRVLRIVPVYFGFLLLLLLVVVPLLQKVMNAGPMSTMTFEEVYRFVYHQWVFWFFLTNLMMAAKGVAWAPLWTGPLWSLAVEEQFYLTWPPLVKNLSDRGLINLAVSTIVFAAGLRWFLDFGIHTSGDVAFFLTPARIDVLAAGAMVAIAMRSPKWRSVLRSSCRPAIIVALTVIGLVGYNRRGFWIDDVWMHTFGFPALGLLFCGVLARSLTSDLDDWFNRILSRTGLREFGRYSYSMYIIHLPINWALMLAWSQFRFQSRFAIAAGLIYVASAIAITFGLARLIWRYYEVRFLNLKRFFPRGSVAEQPIVAAAST